MKKNKYKAFSHAPYPDGTQTSKIDKKRGIVWVLNPIHKLREQMVWDLSMKGYTIELLSRLFDLSSSAVSRIKWNHHRRVKDIDKHICDFCNKYDEEDVYWRDGLYDLCSDCYNNALFIRRVAGSKRYRAIKYKLWKFLKNKGMTNKDIEALVHEKDWDMNTPVTHNLKQENERVEKILNEK
jgi:hypothetical protein